MAECRGSDAHEGGNEANEQLANVRVTEEGQTRLEVFCVFAVAVMFVLLCYVVCCVFVMFCYVDMFCFSALSRDTVIFDALLRQETTKELW